MFYKNNPTLSVPVTGKAARKESIPNVMTKDMNILGNIVSEGVVDFDGMLDGNIRCGTLTLRQNAKIKGEVEAEAVFIYGTVKGLIRAKNVHLFATCHVEGIIMHENIAIEDGAFIDGKFKRTDKPVSPPAATTSAVPFFAEDDVQDEEDANGDAGAPIKMLENIRLIR